MNRIFAHLTLFLIRVTCTLGIGQPYKRGDHSYKTEIEVEWHFGWRGTVNSKKSLTELTVILPQPHSFVSL